jgi:hypothetical protein
VSVPLTHELCNTREGFHTSSVERLPNLELFEHAIRLNSEVRGSLSILRNLMQAPCSMGLCIEGCQCLGAGSNGMLAPHCDGV